MKKRGRPVLGGFAGLFFGLALSVLALVFGLLALDSIVVIVLPVLGIIVGVVLGLTAPFGRSSSDDTAPAPA